MTRWCIVLGLLAGCSFSLSGPEPSRPRLQRPKCDSDKGLVVVDGVLATAMGITTIGVAAGGSSSAILPAILGAVFMGAAIHGSHTVDACRADLVAYAAESAAGSPIAEQQPGRRRPARAVRGAPVDPYTADDQDGTAEQAGGDTTPTTPATPPPAATPTPPSKSPAPPPAARDPWADFWKVVQ
jgi:hypothetical protein